MAIRGLAGPYTIVGENFAPGTTAADIESAMTPFGGVIESCRIVKTKPFIIVEMVFASREGGERVIETFNNKTVSRCTHFSASFFPPFFFVSWPVLGRSIANLPPTG